MKGKKIRTLVITGGAGFLGRAVARELQCSEPLIMPEEIRILDIAPDVFDARSSGYALEASRKPCFRPAPDSGLDDPRIRYIVGDIRDRDTVQAVMRGADAVVHLASIVDWGTHTKEEVFATNVTGAENVMQAALEEGVQAFVYTSSLDAICTGKPIQNGDESLPYPVKFPNAYCESKAEGEKLAKKYAAAGLNIVSLRPTGVYGEADPYHVSSLVQLAEKGPYVRIGNGKSRCQHVYVGNVAHAHLLAVTNLLEGNEKIRGQAYFLTDSPPKNFFGFLDTIVEASGYTIRPKNVWIPKPVMWIAAVFAEGASMLLRPFRQINPKVSRFAVSYTCSDFILSGEKAGKDFGYIPKYSEEEAFSRTVEYFRQHGPVVR